MRKHVVVLGAGVLMACALTAVRAYEASDLPAGPIRDRHELMEDNGKNAKIIGDAVKSGNFEGVAAAAEKIQQAAAKIPGLFPKGSTDPKSRAKPEIWTDWAKFEADAKDLAAQAGELQMALTSGGNVPAEAQDLFGACKKCHDQFRKPEEKKK